MLMSFFTSLHGKGGRLSSKDQAFTSSIERKGADICFFLVEEASMNTCEIACADDIPAVLCFAVFVTVTGVQS